MIKIEFIFSLIKTLGRFYFQQNLTPVRPKSKLMNWVMDFIFW